MEERNSASFGARRHQADAWLARILSAMLAVFFLVTLFSWHSQRVSAESYTCEWSKHPGTENNQIRRWQTVKGHRDLSKLVVGAGEDWENSKVWLIDGFDSSSWSDITPPPGIGAWEGVTMNSDPAAGMKLIAANFAGNKKVWYSTSDPPSWNQSNISGEIWKRAASSADGQKAAIVTWGGKIYYSSNGGAHWSEATGNGATAENRYGIAASGSGEIMITGVAESGSVATSSDFGASWKKITQGPPSNADWRGFAASSDGTHLGAAAKGGYIWLWCDPGSNGCTSPGWRRVDSGTIGNAPRSWMSLAMDSTGKYIAAGEGNDFGPINGSIWISSDWGQTWTQQTVTGNWLSLLFSGDGGRIVALSYNGYVWRGTCNVPPPPTLVSIRRSNTSSYLCGGGGASSCSQDGGTTYSFLTGIDYEFTFIVDDPRDQGIQYGIDWTGSGTIQDYSPLFSPFAPDNQNHSFLKTFGSVIQQTTAKAYATSKSSLLGDITSSPRSIGIEVRQAVSVGPLTAHKFSNATCATEEATNFVTGETICLRYTVWAANSCQISGSGDGGYSYPPDSVNSENGTHIKTVTAPSSSQNISYTISCNGALSSQGSASTPNLTISPLSCGAPYRCNGTMKQCTTVANFDTDMGDCSPDLCYLQNQSNPPFCASPGPPQIPSDSKLQVNPRLVHSPSAPGSVTVSWGPVYNALWCTVEGTNDDGVQILADDGNLYTYDHWGSAPRSEFLLTMKQPQTFTITGADTITPSVYDGVPLSCGSGCFKLPSDWNPDDHSIEVIGGGGGGGAVPDQLYDTPSHSFPTFNPLEPTSIVLSQGNLRLSYGAATAGRSSIFVSKGKWYWEYTYNSVANNTAIHGVCKANASLSAYPGTDASGWSFYGYDGTKWNNNSASSYGSTVAADDVVMVALDMDNGKIWWGKNGTWFNSGDPVAGANAGFTGLPGDLSPCAGSGAPASGAGTYNFGQGGQSGLTYYPSAGGYFKYEPPSGYKALSTANLQTLAGDAEKKPSSYVGATSVCAGKLQSHSAGTPVTLVLTTSGYSSVSCWIVPMDWNNANNSVEVIGGGQAGFSGAGVAGGAGGSYAKRSNIQLTPGSSISIKVGAGGTPSGGAGGDTYFNASSCAAAGSNAVCAKGGGSSSTSVGDITRAGGNGGSGLPVGGGGGGGGGAGGTVGAGSNGGGAGARHPAIGGNGGNGGGVGGAGGAGGNPDSGISAAAGAAGTDWSFSGQGAIGCQGASCTAGAGGGGGGGSGGEVHQGARGGMFGGGGGGGGGWPGGTGGNGAPGVIVIKYISTGL